MAYGDNRTETHADTFDSSISGSWTNGNDDYDAWTWVTGGYVGPATTGANNLQMFYSATAPNNDQYARATIQTFTGADSNYVAAAARCASGTDQSAYGFWAGDSPSAGYNYALLEFSSTGGETTLASTGTGADRATGDILTIECEGTTLRGGSTESGGADTQRLTTTDNTLTSGYTGLMGWAQSAATSVRVTAWSQGNIGAAAATLIHRHLMLGVGT